MSIEKPQIERALYEPSLQELRPGGASEFGFLKKDQTLEQVLERDKHALEILGYSSQELADLLGPITEQAVKGDDFEYTAPNGKQYDVGAIVHRGSQECPWHDSADWKRSSGSLNMYLTEKGLSEDNSILIAGLLRHLIEKHEFFEGGHYRISPEMIVEMFGNERIPGSLEEVKKLDL